MYTENIEILKEVLASRVQRMRQVCIEVNNLSKEVGTLAGWLTRQGVAREEVDKIITDNSKF